MNCIEPLDLSDKTFIEVIDAIRNVPENTVIRQNDYDRIYFEYIESPDMNLKQRDIFYINITRFSPKTVPNDFTIPISN